MFALTRQRGRQLIVSQLPWYAANDFIGPIGRITYLQLGRANCLWELFITFITTKIDHIKLRTFALLRFNLQLNLIWNQKSAKRLSIAHFKIYNLVQFENRSSFPECKRRHLKHLIQNKSWQFNSGLKSFMAYTTYRLHKSCINSKTSYGWLNFDHILMYKKYTAPCPLWDVGQ